MSLDVSLIDPTITYNDNYNDESNELYTNNITHNLNKMAEEAGIYYALWRPEEIDKKYAKDIISLLEEGLKKLRDNPQHYEKFNSPNGWGLYKHFVPFVEKYLKACKKYPDSIIEVSR